ncbi:Taurine catabolism dioxygenase TauD, TfdA family [Roseimaritima multifibrata]|uniref:Taurine catabolism dioxygenase TauD, TfdA family n=1 Tax=Roseimaritima multifibrata TaxID=1930274 RepID=A0A517ML08_9BACT|nr:TauD/TfdA family dioxygenase [Roseimaritima multifibrata]QDS95571.1 Taurine catabolism dioxygenase TauD, TfdA family [Roseimaritima multifibrata]
MTSESLSVAPMLVAGQQKYGDADFPLVLGCDGPKPDLPGAIEWAKSQRADLMQQLQRHGAILFRGFPLSVPEDVDAFVAAFDLENFPYEQSLSNAVRINYTPRIFSANEAPSDVTIFLHHEMAQTPVFPAQLFFFCQQPAEAGGATPLCRSDVLFEQIAERFPTFAADCEAKGLQYSTVMPSESDPTSGMGRNWQSTFRANDRDEAEQRMRELGYTWVWQADGCLRATSRTLPAVYEIEPGRKSFFNQLIAAFQGWKDDRNDPSKAITFGDGTPLPRDTVIEVAQMAEALTFDVPWQAGDLAFVDNRIVMHGRRSFTGKRRVLASLATPQKQA